MPGFCDLIGEQKPYYRNVFGWVILNAAGEFLKAGTATTYFKLTSPTQWILTREVNYSLNAIH
jgi:hypothetical protein